VLTDNETYRSGQTHNGYWSQVQSVTGPNSERSHWYEHSVKSERVVS